MSPAGESPGTAVVAGSTGYLGKHVVRALHRDGYIVLPQAPGLGVEPDLEALDKHRVKL